MKPYGLQTKRSKSENDKKGKWSRVEWANFLRQSKKKARQASKKQIIGQLNDIV